ncbi:cobalt-zinc-cadmium efflux system outer membrane protein [Spirosoma oryzae]|uniref:Cobalt-zinc-cadmium efflux system outer membrane protein n=1 Tax=Spirosoma oryzae TaxID=1469603 RepID=A0A2T0SRH7_9BACT|nr:TolC family protein [Spirosoma oryzae]PRY36014.1 cobalt-zinc-cadmium efflux system outer membrane protein [Spirosoma oryzae]
MIRTRTLSSSLFLLLTGWLCAGFAGAQVINPPSKSSDTLRVTLPQLEQQFVERNFQLLAQRYQIDIADAAITQAGLRPNPNLWFQGNLYNPQTSKFLQYGPPTQQDRASGQYNSGAYAVQLQQVVLLAGKRSKLVALAESNRTLAQVAFRDLMRTLHYQLYSTYANLYYDIQAWQLFTEELARQQRLVESYRIALQTGGVAPYEVTRLEVAVRDLEANLANYNAQIADEQATLRILVRQPSNAFILPVDVPAATNGLPQLRTALDSALTNRPDIALSQEQINNAQRSLTLERARRTPDLTLGLYFEKYSNAYDNFTGFQAAMDLPIRNRNQGAIRSAETTLKSVTGGLDNQQTVVQSDVLNAYDKLNTYYQQYNTRPSGYLDRIQNISVEATKAYNARTIGLLDYLDKIRTYQQAQLNTINLRNNLFQSQQLFNYVTNTRFF